MVNLGNVLQLRGELGAAEESFRRAEALGIPEAAFNLGNLLQKRGDLEGAESAWGVPCSSAWTIRMSYSRDVVPT